MAGHGRPEGAALSHHDVPAAWPVPTAPGGGGGLDRNQAPEPVAWASAEIDPFTHDCEVGRAGPVPGGAAVRSPQAAVTWAGGGPPGGGW